MGTDYRYRAAMVIAALGGLGTVLREMEQAQTNQTVEREELQNRGPSPLPEYQPNYTTAQRKAMGLPHQGEQECARRRRQMGAL